MKKIRSKKASNQAALPPVAGEEVVIAVDLSRSKWVYACRWGFEERRRLSTAAERRHLLALVREYQELKCDVHVVYEACGFGFSIAWLLEQQGATVSVVAPSTVEKAPGSTVKTDGLDAGDLAWRYERGTLKGIYIPTAEQHQMRQLSRTYEQALSDRRREQTRLRLLLQEHGLIGCAPSEGWKAFVSWLHQQTLPPAVALCVGELEFLRGQADLSVKRLGQALRKVARLPQYATVVDALSQQPGVGAFTAIRFILEICDIHRFPTADSLANYLGLTPSEYSSGEMVHRGRVRRCGPSSVRAWLVQCAWVCVGRGEDKELAECYARLVVRAGKKKAIVAVARRLALRLRARWLESEATAAKAA